MASSSSTSLSRPWRYCVFASFHGKDVRKTFLSHLRKQFNYNGITMFDDEGIERSKTLPVALTQAIRDSRISIVVLSKNYASSSWCLKELVEILKCKEGMGQIVMTVFHGVDPSDVRNQTGEFGIAFNETCARNTEEQKRSWSQALTHVGNIAGEHFQNWVNEAQMIEKIAKDVLDKRNITPSKDFDGMIGLDTHLREMESLLDLDYDGVKVVAIVGPAGIGKTTIAWALLNLFSDRFQLTCFVDNLRGSYPSGSDVHSSKLRVQEQFLSKLLNHNGLRICHLGAVKENLCDQKVLIILDDVSNLNQLEALANETTWFGPGSRIIVTTENKELLQQHGIYNTYHVKFPSREEAREILCSYAFKQSSPCKEFHKFLARITELCDDLPLALRVVGSSLRGKKEDEWEDVVNRLETILDREIEDVLRVGYESLDENEQILFLHIAVFFDGEDGDHVKAMFVDGNVDVKCGLKILVYRSLIEIKEGRIVMHKLLQQMARQVIRKQEPLKRQILMDTHEICDVLENETGTRVVSGISFDISDVDEVYVSKKALKRMRNLRFLRVYKRRGGGNDTMHIGAEMEFPGRLRLLDWQRYPSKCLPPTFHPENLVKLCMPSSQLEYLWQGTQKLTNLKNMALSSSYHLKQLPDLSNATKLENLDLSCCKILAEIPSSFSHLQKLRTLSLIQCINLQVIPPQLNLASLEMINMNGCIKVRNFPFISTKFRDVDISHTGIEYEEVAASISLSPHLLLLRVEKIRKLKGLLTYLPTSLLWLQLSYTDIERIPDCIKALHQLTSLFLCGCTRLTSLPELPPSLVHLDADGCESLETVFCPLNRHPHSSFSFTNCLKLDQKSRRGIIKSSFSHGKETTVPGRQVPAKFDQRAKGNILTIRLDALSSLSGLHVCVVLSSNHHINKSRGEAAGSLMCSRIGKGDLERIPNILRYCLGPVSRYPSQHLVMFHCDLRSIDPSEMSREKIVLKFTWGDFDYKKCRGGELIDLRDLDFKEYGGVEIIECGAYIRTKETIEDSYSPEQDYEFQPFEDHSQLSLMSIYCDRTDGVICEPEEEENLEHIDCWSWLFRCFNLSVLLRSLVSGRSEQQPR